MVPEGFRNFIAKDDWPANSHDVNPLETIWIIFDQTTYKDPAPKTLDELRQWLRFTWKMCLQARFGSSHILHLTTYKMLDNINEDILVTKKIFQLFNVKWILNKMHSFTKGIFNNQWNLSEEKISTHFWNTL